MNKKRLQIFRLSGGLGNQFFSYAAAYQCCKENGYRLGLDVSTQEAKWFFRNYDLQNYAIEVDQKISYRLGDKLWDHLLLNHVCRRMAIGFFTPTIYEDKSSFRPDVFKPLSKRTYYLIGDWQRLQYFDKYADDIKKMFVYQKALSDGATNWKTAIMKEKNSVAVHARRGDYVSLNAALESDYFIKAIELMGGKLQNPTFYCFSEDIGWLKEALSSLQEKYRFEYVEYDSDEKGIEDFELMRLCNHQIVANSTYSWWAAYLNSNPEKTVIHPNTHNDDFWPREWICVEQ